MDINLTPVLRQRMGSYPRTRGRYNSSELYFINNGSTTPEQWMNPKEKDMKQILLMWGGTGMHNQIQALLGQYNCEKKVEFVYKDIVLVAKADCLPPDRLDEVWELKTSDKKMNKSKPWQDHQVKLYCTMFKKEHGLIYQPLQDDNGLYLKHLKTVDRDDVFFEKELEKLYQFHLEVEKLW
jgi:hypothetical protein